MTRHIVLVAVVLLFGGSSALACTAEGGRLAAQARAEGRLELRMVRGTYHVLSVAQRSEVRFSAPVNVRTYRGRITSRSGRVYDTSHEGDNAINLCGGFDQPVANAKGVFFLRRAGRGSRAPYYLVDWEGSYVASPAVPATVSTTRK